MSEWMPIDTAPKDGTWVLGYEPRRYVEDTIRVWQWVGHAGEYGTGMWVDAADNCNDDEQPTHWQPLPASPESRAALSKASANSIEEDVK